MKASDLAKLMGVTPQTIRNHVNRGILNPLIINHRYYFTMEEVERYLRKGKDDGIVKSGAKAASGKEGD